MHSHAIKTHLQHLSWVATRLGDLLHPDPASNFGPIDAASKLPMTTAEVTTEVVSLRAQLREEFELVDRELGVE